MTIYSFLFKKMIHSLSARSISLRACLQRFSKPTLYLSAKCMSSSTDNIVKSSYPDITVSQLSLSNYLLENVKDIVDKPAVVSVVCFLNFPSSTESVLSFGFRFFLQKFVLWPFGVECVMGFCWRLLSSYNLCKFILKECVF